jgi:hypothetical protein
MCRGEPALAHQAAVPATSLPPPPSPPTAQVLTSVRPVNKTDVLTLLTTFGSVAGVFNASARALGACPGVGDRKVARLLEALHAPLPGGKKPAGDAAASSGRAVDGGGAEAVAGGDAEVEVEVEVAGEAGEAAAVQEAGDAVGGAPVAEDAAAGGASGAVDHDVGP